MLPRRSARRSEVLAASFGLRPGRYQSGEQSNSGRTSRAGDLDDSSALFLATNAIMNGQRKSSPLRALGARLSSALIGRPANDLEAIGRDRKCKRAAVVPTHGNEDPGTHVSASGNHAKRSARHGLRIIHEEAAHTSALCGETWLHSGSNAERLVR